MLRKRTARPNQSRRGLWALMPFRKQPCGFTNGTAFQNRVGRRRMGARETEFNPQNLPSNAPSNATRLVRSDEANPTGLVGMGCGASAAARIAHLSRSGGDAAVEAAVNLPLANRSWSKLCPPARANLGLEKKVLLRSQRAR